MANFIVDSSFWDLFPDAKLGVVLLKNYRQLEESPRELQALLVESNEMAKSFVEEEPFAENPVIQVYRQAFQKFKTKKGARSSIEALLKRAKSGKPVGTILPLVDIYNAASLRYAMPCGAEDLDRFQGNLELGLTEGGDDFYLIGSDENSPTLPGELCYKDEAGAVCRCLNWRDGERTMIRQDSQNAFLVIELLDPSREEALEAALQFIVEQAQTYLGGQAVTQILDRESGPLTI
ncbi:B3/4 domain-containing protein [Streptococcus danieliae]|uniref:B3/4 domain-containing protein n=1 Tax=Streptococcus danieliae TaxID=747656 RepID=A0A7Z0LE78_9STRE|nr:B3/4 domain-containing protein [Streptococcus danieliae]MBF0717864.1 B3/4 domain-containing protein [Streptococcus danieliae]NYS49794.1 B3/4 domain-containing protein [Streptococcus danieliae]